MSINGNSNDTRWMLPKGKVLRRTMQGAPNFDYLIYLPTSVKNNAPLLIAVHGLSRNTHEQMRVFSKLSELYGVIVAAPNFSEEQFKDYQRLGRIGLGLRADLFLNECIVEIGLLTGAEVSKIFLFGFSGGAQFAHRYLMVHPHRVARAVVVGAGWYTFPDAKLKFPYGIRSTKRLPGVIFNPEEFLTIPVSVLAGEHDTSMTALRRNIRVDEQQGKNRVQRARNWVVAMREAAKMFGMLPMVTFTEVPHINHSFTQFYRHGALTERVFNSLFDIPFSSLKQTKSAVQEGDNAIAENVMN